MTLPQHLHRSAPSSLSQRCAQRLRLLRKVASPPIYNIPIKRQIMPHGPRLVMILGRPRLWSLSKPVLLWSPFHRPHMSTPIHLCSLSRPLPQLYVRIYSRRSIMPHRQSLNLTMGHPSIFLRRIRVVQPYFKIKHGLESPLGCLLKIFHDRPHLRLLAFFHPEIRQ
jgi:hypothetical protein